MAFFEKFFGFGSSGFFGLWERRKRDTAFDIAAICVLVFVSSNELKQRRGEEMLASKTTFVVFEYPREIVTFVVVGSEA